MFKNPLNKGFASVNFTLGNRIEAYENAMLKTLKNLRISARDKTGGDC